MVIYQQIFPSIDNIKYNYAKLFGNSIANLGVMQAYLNQNRPASPTQRVESHDCSSKAFLQESGVETTNELDIHVYNEKG